MDAKNKELLDNRIKQYLTGKLQQEFGEDFELIKNDLDRLIERYSLKELMLISRIEIDKNKKQFRNRMSW